MYSPKINEKYIPLIYQLAKIAGIPMTAVVNEAISLYLEKQDVLKLLQYDNKNDKGG